MTQSKKNSFYKKRSQLQAKRRKPIAVFYIPPTTSMDILHKMRQVLEVSIGKEYHIVFTISDEPRVEVHGSSKVTSFELNELQKYILDEIPKINEG